SKRDWSSDVCSSDLDCDISVLFALVNAQCFSKLLYGTNVINLSNTDKSELCHAYNSVFYKVFHSFDDKIICNCPYYTNHLDFTRSEERRVGKDCSSQ